MPPCPLSCEAIIVRSERVAPCATMAGAGCCNEEEEETIPETTVARRRRARLRERFAVLQSRVEAWKRFANELTAVIQCIIEFAKLVEGFMRLSQEDQIRILKAEVFELALMAVSLCYCKETATLTLNKTLVSPHIFSLSREEDVDFVNQVRRGRR